jgi:hypothetical protein
MRKSFVYFAALWLLFLAHLALGQTSTGSIVGTVTDQSGAQIADATITVTNVATGVVRSTVTNNLGAYSAPVLPPGTYRITASKPGFAQTSVEDLVLRIDQVFQRDITMRVGAVSEEVTVKAETVALATQNASLGQIVSSQEAVDLPLNGRSFIQLATLSAGTSSPGNGQGESVPSGFGRPNVSISVSGQTEYTTDIRIDGIPSKDIVYGPVGMQVDVDSIAEFNVQRGYSPADVGVSGRINVLTKSGTNQLHGSAWEFIRNDVLDTKNYFATQSLPFRQNQFGASVGGPIIKNKLFFFFDYSGFRVRRTNPALGTVPTPSMLAGDFTGLAPVIDPTTGQPFPNNIIPPGRISTFAKNYNSLLPPPNTSGASNLVGSTGFSRNDNGYNFRADYSASQKNLFFGRYTHSNSSQFSGSLAPLSGNNSPLNGTNIAASWTHIFTPSLLNNLKVGLNRTINDPFLPENVPGNTNFAQLFGLHNLTDFSQCNTPPSVSIAGYLGIGNALCIFLTTNNYHYIDNLAFTRGRHRMNMGFEITHVFMRQVVGVFPEGSISFTGQFTGNAVADYLLGIPLTASAQHLSRIPDRTAIWPSFYFDDVIQLTPKLTLSAGLRWSYFQPLASKHHDLVSFNPNVPGGGWLYEPGSGLDNIGTIGPAGLTTPDKNNWSPRLGLAYHLSQNTVVRSSYGIFYQPPAGNRLNAQQTGPPFLEQSSVTSDFQTPTISMDSGTLFPSQSPPFLGPSVAGFGYAVNAPAPYLQSWTLSVQRGLPGGILAEAAYVGSKGTHEDKIDDLNRATAPPPAGFTGDLQTLRPFPNFNSILWVSNVGNSSYNALQFSVQKSLQHGLSFLANYTYSKAIDDDSFDNKACRCYVFGNLDKSLSLFDQRHRVIGSLTYQLPARKLSNPVANAVLAGWTINSITSLQSGFPFSTSTAVDYSERPSVYGWNEPLQVCKNGNLPRGQQTPVRWFDTSCFVAPPLGTLGNAGFNNLFTNGFINEDFSLLKDFPIRESLKVEFRAEFFNLFNHPNFGQPDGTLEDQTFGQVLSALPGREVQFGLKVLW